ncbi:MAG: DUF1835 domain-containing protein [Chitinophagaceae bacterium]
MIHIVFQAADEPALEKSFELDEKLRGEIIQVKDDFAVGPLGDIYSPDGIGARKEWWRNVLAGGDYEGTVDNGTVNDEAVVTDLVKRLEEDEKLQVWIWAAQNKHDVCSYYWLTSQLAEFQGRIFILYLNNLPFINEKGGLFYPTALSQIPAREFVKAKKLARPVTPSEFEVDGDEWKKYCAMPGEVRLLEGGKKLTVEDASYFDSALLSLAAKDWLKVPRFLNNFSNHAKETTGDGYLLWRLKLLISSGKFEARGEVKNMKDFEIKIKPEEILITQPV